MTGMLVLFIMTGAWASSRDEQEQRLPVVKLSVNGKVLTAEVAQGLALQKGLMGRTFLPPNHGMLFVYEVPRVTAMWMKDTLIPLSVAFLDEDGVILNIEDMEPLTEDLHFSKGLAAYALEMNQGWFDRNGIRPGDRVDLGDKAFLDHE